MKTIRIDVKGLTKTIMRPDNCQHPTVYPPVHCEAVNRHNPECDCRWCVYNKEFGKANGKERGDE